MILSVALCTCNGERFLREQLNSILDQILPVDEIVICDDASSDGTQDILSNYQQKYPDIIKLHFNERSIGTIKNFEKAISLTNGQLIFLSDHDDIWSKNKISVMTSFFNKHEDCKLLFTNALLIDEKSNSLDTTLWDKWGFQKPKRQSWKNNYNAFNDLLNNDNKITGATVCFHKSLKKYVIPIEVPLGYWHDAWLGLHASAQKGLFFIDRNLIEYRIHQGQQIGISKNVPKVTTVKGNGNYLDKADFYSMICQLYPAHMDSTIQSSQKKRSIWKRFSLWIFNKIK
ncbi:glycosyltransferase family 2 protein [Salinimicrobium terrae]|uniref:glycosyltransferase family 2 protein n=1 Tax=Salinimicrobium terrae TaxID=470866 RepID=UPI0003F62913|nr:glycosyltransferase family 2 protein [Salinimicrobium terrae]